MQDIKLVQKISDEILNLVIDGMNGKLDDVTLGDLQGIAEAAAMKIINKVKEHHSNEKTAQVKRL